MVSSLTKDDMKLPFFINNSSFVEIESSQTVIIFPIVKDDGENNVFREVYSAKFTYIKGQFDLEKGTLKKRMSLPREMDARSKVLHLQNES
jgi:hypothetical protein